MLLSVRDLRPLTTILTQAEPASPPNENIDTSSTNTAEAAKKFAGSDFDNSLTNYSNRIDRQQMSFSSGVAGETRDEKLARIKLELQELAESAKDDGKDDVDALHVMLEGLEVKRRQLPLLGGAGDAAEDVSAASAGHTTSHVTPQTGHVTSEHFSKLVSLENRLSIVESSLYDPNSPETTPLPLASAIRDLMLKLSLLTSSPQTLQAQQTRIQNVKRGGGGGGGGNAVRVESRAESRGESRFESRGGDSRVESRMESRDEHYTSSSSSHSNVDIVYAHLSTITYLSHVVPKLVLRLKTLRQVHNLASQSVGSLATVNQQIQELEEAVQKWTQVLEVVEGRLGEGES